MIKGINLQRFAEGDVTPDEPKEAILDNKPEVKEPNQTIQAIRNAFGISKKEPAKDTKEPEKPAAKEPDAVVEPEKKEVKQEEPTKEPEFDEILYNKEKVKIPVTERQTYLQKGYNYDKVKTDAETANAALLRVAKLEGFSTTKDYLAELDKRESVKLAEAVQEAVDDPDKINEIINSRIENHPKVIETQEKERKQALKDAKTELGKDEFFKELEPEFDRLMEQNPTAEPDLVYSIIVGKYIRSDDYRQKKSAEQALSVKEKEAIKESAVKATIADVHDKERRAAPKGGDAGDGKETVQPSQLTTKLAGIFGVSAAKVAQRTREITKGR